MTDESLIARVFEALNANPEAKLEDLGPGVKASTFQAYRLLWRQTRHKEYTSESTIADPASVARPLMWKAAHDGLTEAEGRDLAIDAGVSHGLAAAIAATVYRDYRSGQQQLKGRHGSWIVRTEDGAQAPVGHNICVDWSQDPPAYSDTITPTGNKYNEWLGGLRHGHVVIQRGVMEQGRETRARSSYLGIFRIDQLTVEENPATRSGRVTFRLAERIDHVPGSAAAAADLRRALMIIASRAEHTTKQSGRQVIATRKWKEFIFDSPDDMADCLATLYRAQNGQCALSGVRMTTEAGDWCVSPDRIDSNGHYERDNLQLVAACVNQMKGATPNDRFLEQLKKIRSAR